MDTTKVVAKMESVQIPTGYAVATASMSTPLWVQEATTYMEFGMLLLGLLVAITTIYLNIVRIIKEKKK